MMSKNRTEEIAGFLLRVAAGFLFVQAGGMKLFGWFGMIPGGHVKLMSELGFAGVLEVFGGSAIILGLFTRPIAFLLSGEMAVAYFQACQPHGTWPIQNQGMAPVLFCFIFLYFSARGAGGWSIDALLLRRRRPA